MSRCASIISLSLRSGVRLPGACSRATCMATVEAPETTRSAFASCATARTTEDHFTPRCE